MQYKPALNSVPGPINSDEFPAVVALWEASVRVTHHFLTEEAIAYFKPLILHDFLPEADLYCIRDDEQQIAGFMGVEGNKLEMLFVHPAAMGQGVGKQLLAYAVNLCQVTQLDVNEDNPQALGFYQHMGFRVVGRSALDPLGKPYPILHMQLP